MKKEFGILVLLVLICIIVSFVNPAFLSAFNLQNNARWIGIYGIFSIGLGIVIITGGIDLSVGSVFALLGVIFAILLRDWHVHWVLALLVVMGGAVALGVWHGWLIAKMRMQPFIVTLCGLLIYRSWARTLAQEETKGFGIESFGWLRPLTADKLLGIPMPFIWLLVIAAIMWIVLHRSIYGRYIYAVGRNEQAAKYSGINSKLVIASAYVICMILTGFAGVILALDINSVSPADFGQSYELYGIAAAVLGGCSLRGGEGSILGIVIGTALLQILQNVVNLMKIPSSHLGEVLGYVILAGVLVDQILTERRRRRVVQPELGPTGSPVVQGTPQKPA